MIHPPWRRWSIVLHRDVGYLAVGLTLAYGISGIAVNHRADWNPSYRKTTEFVAIAPIIGDSVPELVATAIARLVAVDRRAEVAGLDPQST